MLGSGYAPCTDRLTRPQEGCHLARARPLSLVWLRCIDIVGKCRSREVEVDRLAPTTARSTSSTVPETASSVGEPSRLPSNAKTMSHVSPPPRVDE